MVVCSRDTTRYRGRASLVYIDLSEYSNRSALAFRNGSVVKWSCDGQRFIRRVRSIGRERGVTVYIDTERGKGSHIVLYYGSRATTVKDRRKEIGPGLLAAIMRQLGLSREDFR